METEENHSSRTDLTAPESFNVTLIESANSNKGSKVTKMLWVSSPLPAQSIVSRRVHALTPKRRWEVRKKPKDQNKNPNITLASGNFYMKTHNLSAH